MSEVKSVEGRNLRSSTQFSSVGNLSEVKSAKGRNLRSNTQVKPGTGSNISQIDPTTASRHRKNKNAKMANKLDYQKAQVKSMEDRFKTYKEEIN